MSPEKSKITDYVLKTFAERANKFAEEFPEESDALKGEMLDWASVVSGLSGGGTLGDTIRAQIMAISDKQGCPPDDVIESLFSPNPDGEISADIIMGRFQLWY